MIDMTMHFKYDKKRGLCMTQAGGGRYFAITSFHPSTIESVVKCLNRHYSKDEIACFGKDAIDSLGIYIRE